MKRLNPSTKKHYKKNDVREDGFVFYMYRTSIKVKEDGFFNEVWKSPKSIKKYNSLDQRIKRTLSSAKRRAKKEKIPFDLDFRYLKSIYPEDNICPALHIEMTHLGNVENSPSLDKVNKELGYVKTNVQWISMKANSIKSDLNRFEIMFFITWYISSILKNFKENDASDYLSQNLKECIKSLKADLKYYQESLPKTLGNSNRLHTKDLIEHLKSHIKQYE